MPQFDEPAIQSPPSKLDNEQLRARLEYGIWREGFERKYAAWSLANSGLKPALLLRGQELADAESWLLSVGETFTKSERQFIYKSVSYSSMHRSKMREEVGDEDLTESRTRTRHFILAMVVVVLAVIGPGLVQFVILGPAGTRIARLFLPQSGPPESMKAAPRPPVVASAPVATPEPKSRPAARPKRVEEPPPPPSAAERERQLVALTQRLQQKNDARGALLAAIEAGDEGRKVRAAGQGGASASAQAMNAAAVIGPILSQALIRRQKLVAHRDLRAVGATPLLCSGARVVLAAIDRTTVQAWDVGTARERLAIKDRTDRLQAAAFDQDCGRIALAGGEYGVGIWSLASGLALQALKGHESDVVTARFSLDGRLLVSGDQDRFARVWDLRSGRTVAVLRGHDDGIMSVDFSPDGVRVATASKDRSARVWDAQTGRPIMSLEGHSAVVTSVDFSSDGKRILTASWDGSAMLWDAATGRTIARMRVDRAAIMTAQFSPDGRFVATTTQANEAYVWDGVTGERLAALSGHTDPVRSVAFSVDGQQLATLAWAGSVRLWEGGTWSQGPALEAGEDRPQAIAFQANGAGLSALTAGGTLISWPVLSSPDELLEEARKAAPPCFSATERTAHGLEPGLPEWCSRLGKLPIEKSAMIEPR